MVNEFVKECIEFVTDICPEKKKTVCYYKHIVAWTAVLMNYPPV